MCISIVLCGQEIEAHLNDLSEVFSIAMFHRTLFKAVNLFKLLATNEIGCLGKAEIVSTTS